MAIFVFPAYLEMGNQLCTTLKREQGHFSVDRFSNQELHAVIETNVTGEECFILSSIAPPDEQLLSFLLLSHTLKKEGARRVLALLPYMAYARDDKKKVGKSLATAWIGSLLQASGVDSVVTIDVHNTSSMQHLCPLPVVSLSPADIFAREITRLGLQQATLVAPDEGARDRCQAVARAANMSEEIIVLEKKRTIESVVHSTISGNVRPQAVVIDDILDTGGTLVSCCEQLQLCGAQDIILMVTHGLFTGTQWQKLWSLGVKQIYCTDSIPQHHGPISANIRTLSVVPLLGEYLQRYGERVLVS